jgi:hypothetical protein
MLLLFAAVLSGCLAAGQVSVPELCNESANIGVPGNVQPITGTFMATFDYPIAQQLAASVGANVVPTDLEITSLTLHMRSDLISNFGFIQQVMVIVPGVSDMSAPLMSFTQTPQTAVEDTLVLSSPSPVNLVPTLQNGDLKAEVTMAGTLPSVGWTFTTKPCVTAKVGFTY